MYLRKLTSLLLAGTMICSLAACGSASEGSASSDAVSSAAEAVEENSEASSAAEENAVSAEAAASSEAAVSSEAAATASEAAEPAEENASGEVPTLNVSWNNDLHNGIMQLAMLIPEEFANDPIHIEPVSENQFDLVKDGTVIAHFDKVQCEGASEAAALLAQGHLDVAYCSSTGMLSAYDSGTDVCILCPVQSGGVSIVAAADAPYNTFEELVEYAKSSDTPIMAGYHSAISSPRIVLEYALTEAGLTVTEDTADYEADVVMMDLKGLSNLIPSLSSGQVEVWAGPVPHPQKAEEQEVGKIIARLDDLPGGKWVDFPCCTMNAMKSVTEEYPEIIQALTVVTNRIFSYANEERDATAEALSEWVGLSVEELKQNDTTYAIAPNDKFVNGMTIYVEAMNKMGKLTGRLSGVTYDDIKDTVFNYSFAEEALK